MILLKSRVKVASDLSEGREVVLAIRGPGDLIEELSAIDNRPHAATCTAMEPVDAQMIPSETFLVFLFDPIMEAELDLEIPHHPDDVDEVDRFLGPHVVDDVHAVDGLGNRSSPSPAPLDIRPPSRTANGSGWGFTARGDRW